MTSPSTAVRTLAAALVDGGVRLLVASPGSRSTPILAACLERDDLEVQIVIDEREAAFHGVGWARVTGAPVALLCTSGSAGAHYLPALLEARASGDPVLAITADRPVELQECAAPQTLDQTDLYGPNVLARATVALGDHGDDELRALRRTVLRLVHRAMADCPGPVHLNVRARKPLELADGRPLPVGLGSAPDPARRLPDRAAVARAAALLVGTDRPVIVAGPDSPARPLPLPDFRGLATALGAPVLAEVTSQLASAPTEHHLRAADALLRSARGREALRPSAILQMGRPPTGAPLQRWLREHRDVPRVLLADAPWPDPTHGAATLLIGDPRESLPALLGAVAEALKAAPPRAFLETAQAADGAARAVVVARRAAGPEAAAVDRTTTVAARRNAVLCLGNSLVAREIELTCPAAVPAKVWHQRGLAGIDGLIAGAAGAARGAAGPAVLLLGDVSYLHGAGGLAVAASCGQPVVVVVLDNGGGRIFEMLPIAAERPGVALAPWTTPPQADPVKLAEAHGAHALRVTTAADLELALEDALDRGGLTVIVAAVGGDAVAWMNGVGPAVDEALGGDAR